VADCALNRFLRACGAAVVVMRDVDRAPGWMAFTIKYCHFGFAPTRPMRPKSKVPQPEVPDYAAANFAWAWEGKCQAKLLRLPGWCAPYRTIRLPAYTLSCLRNTQAVLAQFSLNFAYRSKKQVRSDVMKNLNAAEQGRALIAARTKFTMVLRPTLNNLVWNAAAPSRKLHGAGISLALRHFHLWLSASISIWRRRHYNCGGTTADIPV
jgi:hypothetical protein